MRILVTGAAGMLGSALVPVLREAGHKVVASDLIYTRNSGYDDTWVDVRRPEHVNEWVTSSTGPEVVVNLAAITSLEECDADPDNAWATNALGVRNVVNACRTAGIPLLHISTAGVFDGTSERPYTEFDTPNPVNTYAASKLAGERFAGAYERSWTLRAGWMESGGPEKDHKFVSLIVGQIRNGAKVIRAASDLYGSPTYGPDFARVICDLIGSDRYGLYHATCGESVSRFEVAQAIVEILGVDVEVQPAPAQEFEAAGFISKRPKNEALRNYCFELEGRPAMRPWREALELYLQEWSS